MISHHTLLPKSEIKKIEIKTKNINKINKKRKIKEK